MEALVMVGSQLALPLIHYSSLYPSSHVWMGFTPPFTWPLAVCYMSVLGHTSRVC